MGNINEIEQEYQGNFARASATRRSIKRKVETPDQIPVKQRRVSETVEVVDTAPLASNNAGNNSQKLWTPDDLLESLRSSGECPICFEIAHEPIECWICGNMFGGKSCVIKLLGSGASGDCSRCPKCGSAFLPRDVQTDRQLISNIRGLLGQNADEHFCQQLSPDLEAAAAIQYEEATAEVKRIAENERLRTIKERNLRNTRPELRSQINPITGDILKAPENGITRQTEATANGSSDQEGTSGTSNTGNNQGNVARRSRRIVRRLHYLENMDSSEDDDDDDSSIDAFLPD